MKRFLFLATCLLIVAQVLAQKPSLSKAYNAFAEKNYEEAKTQIDLCVTNEKFQNRAQTYLYKGNIYFFLSNTEYEKARNTQGYVDQYPNASIEAFDAFVKAKELKPNVEGFEMYSPDSALSKIYPLLFIRGANLLVENKHNEAIPFLEKAIISYEMVPNKGGLHGELYYYYAYALEMKGNKAEARANYEKAIKDNSENVNVYIRLLEGYKEEGNTQKMQEVLSVANQKFPGDPLLYVSNITHLYAIKDTVKARQMLKNIPPKVYADAISLVNISNFYVQDKDYKNGYDLLIRARALEPENYNVNYNLGVCAYYMAQDMFLKANELEVAGKKVEADPIKAEADRLFAEAEGYFEYVISVEPNDMNILMALKSIYARTLSPKFDEIDKKIKALGGN